MISQDAIYEHAFHEGLDIMLSDMGLKSAVMEVTKDAGALRNPTKLIWAFERAATSETHALEEIVL